MISILCPCPPLASSCHQKLYSTKENVQLFPPNGAGLKLLLAGTVMRLAVGNKAKSIKRKGSHASLLSQSVSLPSSQYLTLVIHIDYGRIRMESMGRRRRDSWSWRLWYVVSQMINIVSKLYGSEWTCEEMPQNALQRSHGCKGSSQ